MALAPRISKKKRRKQSCTPTNNAKATLILFMEITIAVALLAPRTALIAFALVAFAFGSVNSVSPNTPEEYRNTAISLFGCNMIGNTNVYTNLIRRSKILTRRIKAMVIKRNYSKTSNVLEDDEKTTHFGFQTIKEADKAKEVHTVFKNVANSYDIMNDVMSMGIHRIWKDIFIQELGPTHGTYLLDAAGGTGDIAFRYINFLKNTSNPHNIVSHVTVSDINQNMLNMGQKRVNELDLLQDSSCSITWKQEDAENLSFPDDSFTAYTIAFGIRNVTHIDKVLSEAYRVLQPGGRFLCLEFSQVNNEVLQWLYDQYSFQIIPVMGQLVTGQWGAYQYLVESIRKFPKQEDFKDMIETAGFRNVTYTNLTFGVVAIHSGFKL